MTSGNRTGRTVLVAEGEGIVRRFLIRALVREGYDASDAASGLDALSALAQEPGRYALLVTCLNLPDLRGEELARRARAIAPWLRVLIITGGGGRNASAPASFGPCLAKPFTRGVFMAAVADVLSDS